MMSYRSPRDEYRLAALWSTATLTLLLTLMAWFAMSSKSVPRFKLYIFLAWLFAVPVLALFIDIRYR